MEIRVHKLKIDDYGYDPPHTQVFISNEGFSARQEDYIDESYWLTFGNELQSFPKTLKHEVIFGEPHFPIFFRAFVYDGLGHSALEVRINNSAPPPYSASVHFYILCEVATLNRLGKLLEKWIRSGEREFMFMTNEKL